MIKKEFWGISLGVSEASFLVGKMVYWFGFDT